MSAALDTIDLVDEVHNLVESISEIGWTLVSAQGANVKPAAIGRAVHELAEHVLRVCAEARESAEEALKEEKKPEPAPVVAHKSVKRKRGGAR